MAYVESKAIGSDITNKVLVSPQIKRSFFNDVMRLRQDEGVEVQQFFVFENKQLTVDSV